jgi:hypothetical protein
MCCRSDTGFTSGCHTGYGSNGYHSCVRAQDYAFFGCFVNEGTSRVEPAIASEYSFHDCQSYAAGIDASYLFAMESSGACQSFASVPSTWSQTDDVECQSDVDTRGKSIGGTNRTAVYEPSTLRSVSPALSPLASTTEAYLGVSTPPIDSVTRPGLQISSSYAWNANAVTFSGNDVRTGSLNVSGNAMRRYAFDIMTTQTTDYGIVSTGSNSQRMAFNIVSRNSSGECFGVYMHTTNYYPKSCHTSVNDGAWHSVAMAYDGKHISLWVDGIMEFSVFPDVALETTCCVVTIGNSLSAYYFTGTLKNVYLTVPMVHVRIANAAVLTAPWQIAEITAYNSRGVTLTPVVATSCFADSGNQTSPAANAVDGSTLTSWAAYDVQGDNTKWWFSSTDIRVIAVTDHEALWIDLFYVEMPTSLVITKSANGSDAIYASIGDSKQYHISNETITTIGVGPLSNLGKACGSSCSAPGACTFCGSGKCCKLGQVDAGCEATDGTDETIYKCVRSAPKDCWKFCNDDSRCSNWDFDGISCRLYSAATLLSGQYGSRFTEASGTARRDSQSCQVTADSCTEFGGVASILTDTTSACCASACGASCGNGTDCDNVTAAVYVATFSAIGCPNTAPVTDWWATQAIATIISDMKEYCDLTCQAGRPRKLNNECVVATPGLASHPLALPSILSSAPGVYVAQIASSPLTSSALGTRLRAFGRGHRGRFRPATTM